MLWNISINPQCTILLGHIFVINSFHESIICKKNIKTRNFNYCWVWFNNPPPFQLKGCECNHLKKLIMLLSKLWSKRNMVLIELLLIKIMPEMIGIFKRKVFTPGFPWFQSLVREQNRIPALQFILGVNSIKLLQVYMYLSLFLDSKPIATLANYIY